MDEVESSSTEKKGKVPLFCVGGAVNIEGAISFPLLLVVEERGSGEEGASIL
jgi:hypothetical protein